MFNVMQQIINELMVFKSLDFIFKQLKFVDMQKYFEKYFLCVVLITCDNRIISTNGFIFYEIKNTIFFNF